MVLSSPTRLNTSSLQTWSDQQMFKTFLQSHISLLCRLRRSSFFNVHDWAPDERELQMTLFIIHFFRKVAQIHSGNTLCHSVNGELNCRFGKASQSYLYSCIQPLSVFIQNFFCDIVFVCLFVCLLTLEAGINNSVIVGNKSEYLAYLNNWIKPIRSDSDWKLCWRASRDGWDKSRFHSLCDKKGPTITIVKVGKYIFGGYTSLSWSEYLSLL